MTRVRFRLFAGATGLALGVAVAHRILFEPGVVGLARDWAIPPDGAQMAALARQTFDGWYSWTLGRPSIYTTEYPVEFLLGLLGALGASGEVLSKSLVVGGPAFAFGAALFLGRSLGMSRVGAVLCGLVYALNPVVLNKLASGQLSFIAGYAFFPLAFGAYARAVGAGAWFRGGLATGAALALATVQIQLGFIDTLIVGLAAAALWRWSAAQRLRTLCVALVTLGAIESPVLFGIWKNYAFLPQIREGVRGGLSWVGSNSVPPAEALKLAGYIVQYDIQAVAAWYGAWSLAAFIVAGCVLAGLFFMPRDIAVVCAAIAGAALVVVTGVYSPLAPLVLWFFEHVTLSQAFLELYDVMAALALVYAVGFGFLFSALRGRWAPVARLGCATVLLVFVAPMLSGDCGGQLAVHPYGPELSAAYERVRGEPGRVVWFPMDQPVSFNGAGAGIEPMWVSAPGSLWRYSLAWPLTAVDMAARAADWEGLVRGLNALSVTTLVQRSNFRSELWFFLPGKDRHTYLQTPLQIPPLAASTFAPSPGVRLDTLRSALPLAYTADGLAYVPQRLAAISAVASSGFVPVGFAASSPRDIPYVVMYDAGDRLDEMLALAGDEPLKFSTDMIDATEGFAPFVWWWWYRPELADAPQGSFAIGRQRCILSAPRDVDRGWLIVSWIGTPEGGRLRVAAAGRTQTFDTNAPRATWLSASMPIDRVRAGDPIVLDALDGSASVAVRAVRVSTDQEMRRAGIGYDALLHGARLAAAWHFAERPYGAWRSGSGHALGMSSLARDYRLAVHYHARAEGSLSVVDAKGNTLAFRRIGPGSAVESLHFAGLGAPLYLTQRGAVVERWRLEERPHVAAVLPQSLPQMQRANGEWDGLGAQFASARNVAVLNVAFWNNWQTDPAARHFPTALGTNAWLTPHEGEPLRIVDGQAFGFHAAHVLGTIVLVLAACAPLLRIRASAAWR